MAEVLLFHHAQGLTAGVRSFADELRSAGHVVHTPDLYEGATFADLDGGGWPDGLLLQIHTMEDDDWGDVDIARELAATIEGAELFVYPGNVHLFTDSSLAAFDEGAAALVRQRVLGFLDGLG